MNIRTRFSERRRVSVEFDPSLKRTKDSFKEECDVNNIMKRYLRTGHLPALANANPVYGDFSDAPSFQEALERVRVAEIAFAALPAAVRRECGNDPALFLERVADPEWALKHKLALPDSVLPDAPGEPARGAPSPKGGQTQPGKAPEGSASSTKKVGEDA